LLPEGAEAVELDGLFGYFYRLPRLPKIASPQVLRESLAEGVGKGLFGLASGASWDAEDAVLRFSKPIDPSEIQFQPGTWLVRAATIKKLIARRAPDEAHVGTDASAGGTTSQVEDAPIDADASGAVATEPGTIRRVTLRVKSIPGDKARDVVKVAVLPLNAVSSEVVLELSIRADGGLAGVPRETLNLVVLEGLRQLGIEDVDLDLDEAT
jgi:hypothetical protein